MTTYDSGLLAHNSNSVGPLTEHPPRSRIFRQENIPNPLPGKGRKPGVSAKLQLKPKTWQAQERRSHARYDGDGKRVLKTDSNGTTSYVYDGSDVIVESNGTTTYYRIPGVGEYSTSDGQSYQMDDQIGSTMGEVGSSSSFKGQYNYDGYGIESDLSGRPSGTTAFRFGGKHGYLTDVDTGMVLCGARYYLPMLGRFLNQDRIGHEGGLNLYGYCRNNPLKAVDPSGDNAYVVTWFGKDWFSGTFGSHAGIAVDWPGSKHPKFFDFGPGLDDEDRPNAFEVAILGWSCEGEVSPESQFDLKNPRTWSHQGDYPSSIVEIATTPSQDQAIRRWCLSMRTWAPEGAGEIPIHSKCPFGYYSRFNWCSDFVLQALINSGVYSGVNAFVDLHLRKSNPMSVRDWALNWAHGKEIYRRE